MTTAITTRTLGNDLQLPAIGLGAMGMSDFYGESDRTESIATLHAALDAGVFYIDSGDFYGMGHNEMLIREALAERRREDVLIGVKFGAQRDPSGQFIGVDNSPAAVKSALAYTLQRLGTDYVDVYYPARPTLQVPIEDTMGAIKDMIDAGYVRHAAISEANAETIRRAHAVTPLAFLQMEYSLISRTVEGDILPTLRELGVGLTAYGVLSRGLLSGHWSAERSEQAKDFRASLPRFQGDNLAHNLKLVEALRSLATEKQATVAQVAIAWVMAQGDDIVPLVGARTRQRLSESLGAVDVSLDDQDLAKIESAIPKEAAAGTRYDEHQMAMLDSER